MPILKPFYRTIRSHIEGPNSGYSGSAFIKDPQYASNGPSSVRTYLLLQRDFEKLCQYVEPSLETLTTFSFRIHELLMRICIESEANLKAILNENLHTSKKMDMRLYRKVDITHHLSSYELLLTTWNGPRKLWKPFGSWLGDKGFGTGPTPSWYKAYNLSKHDRHDHFKTANMDVLTSALAGLLVLITAQFRDEDFAAGLLMVGFSGGGYYTELRPATGNLFRINRPDDWPEEEMYGFDWNDLKDQVGRFEKIDYDLISIKDIGGPISSY